MGIGATTVDNNDIGVTDGTTHATISVAAGSPAAAPPVMANDVLSELPDMSLSRRLTDHTLDRLVARVRRADTNAERPSPVRDSVAVTDKVGVATTRLHAVRRPVSNLDTRLHCEGESLFTLVH
jgi:hypothetical protein